MIFPLSKWYFDINWHNLKKRWSDVFQIYPIAIHLNPPQFCPSMPLLGFPVFCLSSSIVLNRYFHILVNSMTIWSVLKLPKIAWPSPFKFKSKKRGQSFADKSAINQSKLIFLVNSRLWSVLNFSYNIGKHKLFSFIASIVVALL